MRSVRQWSTRPYWFEQRELLIADAVWMIELSYGTAWIICDF